MAMAMAAVWASRGKIVAYTIMHRSSTQQPNNGQHVRRWTEEYLIPHRRRYAVYARDIKTGVYDYDLAVSKSIEEYHKQEQIVKEMDPLKAMVRQDMKIKEDRLVYPLRGKRRCHGDLKIFFIVLKTIFGDKYASVCVAPVVSDEETAFPQYMEHESMKRVFFQKLDSKVPFFFDRVVSAIVFRKSRRDPRIMAAANFALAQHNKEEKLVRVMKASSQMMSEYEVLRMRFEGELQRYEAIVLVSTNNNPEKMELVLFRNQHCHMFDRWMFGSNRRNMGWATRVYSYDDGSNECYRPSQDSEFAQSMCHTEFAVWRKDYLYGNVECWHKGPPVDQCKLCKAAYADGSISGDESDDDAPVVGSDECSTDDPDVIAAARFALSLCEEKENLRRVIKAFSVNKIPANKSLRIIFEGEMRWYDTIVLVHGDINNPENMTLFKFGRSEDDCSIDELGDASFMHERLPGFKYGYLPVDFTRDMHLRITEAVKSWTRKPTKASCRRCLIIC